MPGTEHGEVIRVDVEEAGGGRGTLWLTVSVEESETWRLVDQRDLETSLELSPAMALLGGRTQVECSTLIGRDQWTYCALIG